MHGKAGKRKERSGNARESQERLRKDRKKEEIQIKAREQWRSLNFKKINCLKVCVVLVFKTIILEEVLAHRVVLCCRDALRFLIHTLAHAFKDACSAIG